MMPDALSDSDIFCLFLIMYFFEWIHHVYCN